MNYKTVKVPNEPITIWTGYTGFEWGSPEEDVADDEIRAIWDASNRPVYHIADMSHLKLDLEQLMQATASVAFGEQALWSHPKLKLAIIVTQDPVILQAAQSMIQATEAGDSPYSQVPMMVLESVDEALDCIRNQMY